MAKKKVIKKKQKKSSTNLKIGSEAWWMKHGDKVVKSMGYSIPNKLKSVDYDKLIKSAGYSIPRRKVYNYQEGGPVLENPNEYSAGQQASDVIGPNIPVVGQFYNLGKGIGNLFERKGKERGTEYGQLLQSELNYIYQQQEAQKSRRKQKVVTDQAMVSSNPTQDIEGFYAGGGEVDLESLQYGDYDLVGEHMKFNMSKGKVKKGDLEELQAKIEERKKQDLYNQQMQMDNRALDSYATEGYSTAGFYKRGGVIPGQTSRVQTAINRGIVTDATTKKSGVAGVEVETNKQGTDKINANIKGNQVKLDDNEVVVTTSDGRTVVISDDNGEATKYKQAIKGKSVKDQQVIADEFAARAIELNPNPGQQLVYGGDIPPYTPPSQSLSNTGGLSPYANPNYYGGGNWQNTYNNYLYGDTDYNNLGYSPYDGNYLSTEQQGLSDNPLQTEFTGQPSYSAMQSPYSKTGQLIRSPKFGQYAMKAGNLALAGANIYSNIQASNRLKNIEYPEFQYPRYKSLDPDANKPLYTQALGEARGAYTRTAATMPRYTTSAADLTNKLANLSSAQAGSLGSIYSQQAADRARTINLDTQAYNRFGENRAIARARHEMGQYGDKVSRLNTQLGLNQSSIASVQNILNNVAKGQYQGSELRLIAARYGVVVEPGDTDQDIIRKLGEATKEIYAEYAKSPNTDYYNRRGENRSPYYDNTTSSPYYSDIG